MRIPGVGRGVKLRRGGGKKAGYCVKSVEKEATTLRRKRGKGPQRPRQEGWNGDC